MGKKYGEMRKSKERVSVVQVHDLLIRKRLCETHHCVCQDKWMFAEENDFKTEMCETLEAVPGTQRPMSAASVISHQISTFMSSFNFPIHLEDLVHQIPRLTNVMAHVLRSSLSQKETTSVSRGLFVFKCQGENLFQIHHPSLLVHRHHRCLSFVRLP